MPATVVIGGQWGDEGKGKIVDFLAQNADIVVRYAGGGNAGHSVENESGKFALRTIPVGMVNSRTRLNIIGRGMVPEISVVVSELKALAEQGVDITRLRIDKAAHLVMPWHIVEDKLEEESRGENRIGTTKNGIGPCYADKIRRIGLRAEDVISPKGFREKYWKLWHQKIRHLRGCFNHFYTCGNFCEDCAPVHYAQSSLWKLEEDIHYLYEKFGNLDNLICDTPPLLWEALGSGQNILLEGAQGFLLDIDHGTYPYVTSSNTGVAAAANGSGIALLDITERIAVIKAYVTRVGEGEFPTRMAGYPERRIRYLAHEYGTVTGRPRRCGWFDTVAFKRVARKNGLTGCAITRLDILDNFKLIGVGVDDPSTPRVVSGQAGSGQVGKGGVRIEWIEGWGPEKSVRSCRSWRFLPKQAKRYCETIACGVPIKYISVGPRRSETIVIS